MPDPNGDITAGQDDVIGSASPVLAGVNNGPNAKPSFSVEPDAPDMSTPPIAPGPSPMGGNQQGGPPKPPPTFFRKLLFSLGQGLIEGTKAGLQAPPGPQGPAIAAQTAINAPQQKRQQLTTNQMNDMNVAMTQLKLHQIQMVTHQMDEDAQNAVYNSGRDVTTALMEKGKVNVLATGDQKSVQDEFTRRQADAKAAGQGLLPLQILPAAGSSAKDPKYALIDVGKDRLTEDMEDTWGAKDLGVSDEDFKAAGLTPFNFKAPAGMDQQKALQLMTTQHLNWLTKSQNQLGQWKRNQANLQQKDKSLQQQLGEFRDTLAYKKWKAQLDADTKEKTAAVSQDKAPAAMLQTASFSQGALEQMKDAQQAMDTMESQGVLGKNLLTNKVEDYLFSKGLADPSWDNNTRRMMGRMKAALGNTATATMRAHTGRTSKEIYEDYKVRFGLGQSWAALRGAMDETKGLLEHYVSAASNKEIKKLREGSSDDTEKKGGKQIQFTPIPH
jgi:hypothetical protein